jgi:hypothetical protein
MPHERTPMSTHKTISFAKSAIRIFAYFGFIVAFPDSRVILFAALALVVSEGFGIAEEIGEK